MRCKTCGFVKKGVNSKTHHWQRQQCSQCHYFKVGRHRRNYHRKKQYEYADGKRHREGIRKIPKAIISEKNLDLYCKLSQIIRGKKCKPKMVFAKQRWTEPVIP